jgi:GNAT superfamily N-acetyltransferase
MHTVVAVARDGQIVGLATTAPARHGPIELAVLVQDDWQRRGVWRLLVRPLVGRARSQGVTHLAVLVESTRPGLVRALAPLGPARHVLDGPTIEAVITIV